MVQSDFSSFVDVRSAQSIRRFLDFQNYEVFSDSGNDLLIGQLANGAAEINVSVTGAEFLKDGNLFSFSDFEFSNVTAAGQGNQLLTIDVEQNTSAERIYVSDEFSLLRTGATNFFKLTDRCRLLFSSP